MLKREAIRAVTYLLKRGAITQPRMSFVLQSCNDLSVVERDPGRQHNDTIYYSKGVTLYFDTKGKEITRERFDRVQALADAVEAKLHPQPSTAQSGGHHMLTKVVVISGLAPFNEGQVLEDRKQIGEYLRTILNEGRFSAPIGEDEIDNILAHADETSFEEIKDVDDEVLITEHIQKYYPDTVPA